MTETLSLVLAQCDADLPGGAARLDWLENTLERQFDTATDLVVLPELFHCGYNIGVAVSEQAEPVDGPFALAMGALARKFQVAFVYGYAERAGNKVYNSALCLDANGVIMANHRKLALPPSFELDHFSTGTVPTVFSFKGVTLGIVICYDVEFPENLRALARAGVDLVVVPTALGADWGVVSEKVVPTRAFENGMFIAYANYCGQQNGAGYYGGSCIVSPDGSDLARAGHKETVLQAKLDISAVERAQSRLPYLRDSRKLPKVTR